MSYTPTLYVPASSPTALLDRTQPMQVTVNVNLNVPGEAWYGLVRFQYRIVGSGTWTYVPSSTTWVQDGTYYGPTAAYNFAYHIFAGSTFPAGDYEIGVRVLTYINGDWQSGLSQLQFFSMGTPPAAPTITTPTAGATITAATSNITFTATGSPPAYQIQVLNGATVEWDSGEVAQTGAGPYTKPATFAVNSVSRTVRVRVKTAGIWSAWATVAVNVAWTPPGTPTFGVTPFPHDRFALGFNHALRFSITTPGGSPAPVLLKVYARFNGSSDPVGVKIGEHVNAASATIPYAWYGARAGVTYQLRVESHAADGTFATSTWSTASGPVVMKGILLHTLPLPLTSTTSVDPVDAWLRLNDDEVEEDYEQEAALVTYAGREYPVVEFGVGSTRRYNVGKVHSKGIAVSPDGIVGTTDLDLLREVIRQRQIVCYQDRRGRVMYGLLSIGNIKDTAYGHSFSLAVDQVYPYATPPSDVQELA